MPEANGHLSAGTQPRRKGQKAMHRHYGMPLETVGHAHDGDDGPTHGPHTHERAGLGDVAIATLPRLAESGFGDFAREQDAERDRLREQNAALRKALEAIKKRGNALLTSDHDYDTSYADRPEGDRAANSMLAIARDALAKAGA